MKVYRYFITYGRLMDYDVEVEKETPTYFFLVNGSSINGQNRARIPKKEDGIPILKDSTHYPYIDFYSSKDQSREFAIKNILEYFRDRMSNY